MGMGLALQKMVERSKGRINWRKTVVEWATNLPTEVM
jgi:hypothetical protein